MTSTQNTEQSTHSRPRVVRREVKVPVPTVKLPPADPKVVHKVRVHICLLLASGVLTAIIAIVAHEPVGLWAFTPTLPNVAMECVDRLNNR